jgi:hypothetical protein
MRLFWKNLKRVFQSEVKYYKSKFHYVKKTDTMSIVVYNTDTSFRIEKNTNGFPDINSSQLAWQPCTKDEFDFQASEVMRKSQKELCN